MNKNKSRVYTNCLSANPYVNSWYSGTPNTIKVVQSPSFSKDQYAISFLNSKSFISAQIAISRNVPDVDIYDALETKVYEELALDMAIEYQIQYIESVSNTTDGNRHFHAFIVDPLTLEHDFEPVISTIKYIDQIVPAPLLYKSLYSKEIITSNGVHCYVYFQESDAFFTLYDNQEFIYTKSLKFSLRQLHERFCELTGEQQDFQQFAQMLANHGLNAPDTNFKKNLIKLFGELFLHINDVITYAKRAYEIKKIDEFIIGSEIGVILGLDEYAQTYLGLKTLPFDFDYGYDTEGRYVDQVHQLMHLYSRLDETERYECNFTIFHRPPPFAKRDSGKLILVTAASIAAALLYPGVYWGLSYTEEFRYAVMAKEYEQVHTDKMSREGIINLKTANKNAAQSLLDEQMNAYKQKQDTLIKIHEKKVDYPMKAKMLAEFTQYFNQYRVQLKNISYSEDQNNTKTLIFGLTSATTQDTTALVKHLTEAKEDKYNFSLDLISYNEDEKSYLSELKAVIK